jgi:hypothetical protein
MDIQYPDIDMGNRYNIFVERMKTGGPLTVLVLFSVVVF